MSADAPQTHTHTHTQMKGDSRPTTALCVCVCVCVMILNPAHPQHIKKCFHRRSIKTALQPTAELYGPPAAETAIFNTNQNLGAVKSAIKSHVFSYWKRLSAVGPVHKARVVSLLLQNGS